MSIDEKWTKVSVVPKNYLKEIAFGALKGKSDISPQWRIKAMTEVYGMCGEGWYFEPKNRWKESGPNGETMVFYEVAVYTKLDDDTWSAPIYGVGGNTIVDLSKGNLKQNDEGYKMALTDALGTALKCLGVASEIYEGNFDGSKYRAPVDATMPTQKTLLEKNPQMHSAFIKLNSANVALCLSEVGLKSLDDLMNVDKSVAMSIYEKAKAMEAKA